MPNSVSSNEPDREPFEEEARPQRRMPDGRPWPRRQNITPLQTFRRRALMTQEQLANIMKIAQQTLARYETGQAIPPPGRRAQFAAVLNTTTDALWPPDFQIVSEPETGSDSTVD